MKNLFLGTQKYVPFNHTGKKKRSYKTPYLSLYFLKQRRVYPGDGSGPHCAEVYSHQIFTGAQVGDRHGARWWDLQAHSCGVCRTQSRAPGQLFLNYSASLLLAVTFIISWPASSRSGCQLSLLRGSVYKNPCLLKFTASHLLWAAKPGYQTG